MKSRLANKVIAAMDLTFDIPIYNFVIQQNNYFMAKYRSFAGLQSSCADLHRLFADLHRSIAGRFKSFADLHRLFADLHRSFAGRFKSFADLHRSLNDLHRSLADLHRSFADLQNSYIHNGFSLSIINQSIKHNKYEINT